MQATVLGILQDAGVYPNLYYGMNLLTEVPQDLYLQDWWYRTTFSAPAGFATYLLDFPASTTGPDLAQRPSHRRQRPGRRHVHRPSTRCDPGSHRGRCEHAGGEGHSGTDDPGPRRRRTGRQLVRLDQLALPRPPGRVSFVSDRNAGVWKQVHLRAFGQVGIGPATVTTDLPLPATDSARLTVYADVRNHSEVPAHGVLRATITREGRTPSGSSKRCH